MRSRENGGVLPLNSQLSGARSAAGQQEGWYLLERIPVITGHDLRDAHAGAGRGRPLGDQLRSHPGRRQAVRALYRSEHRKPARHRSRQSGAERADHPEQDSDTGRITGAANHEEAADLALNLRAGSLPASVMYLEERSIGPALGADSIRQGIYAGIAGVIAVVVVMLFITSVPASTQRWR